MLLKTATASLLGCCVLALAATANGASPFPAAPGAKVIHVRQALARERLPDAPADEASAAGWQHRPLPRVTYLRKRTEPFNSAKLLPGVKPLIDSLSALER